MWNDYKKLNVASNTLIALVILVASAGIGMRIIHLPIFQLKAIDVVSANEGKDLLQNVTRRQIERIVQNEISGNFLTVDLVAVRQAFLALHWVRDMTIKREWPNRLHIELEEHTALARWGSDALVNTHGEVFHAEVEHVLPIFFSSIDESAQEMTKRYKRFSQLLAPLKQYVAEINLSARHAWQIRLKVGTVLELGREKVEARLTRYVSVYDRSIAYLNQQEPLAYMDLRYANGMAIRLPAATKLLAPYKPGFKEAT